jgi:hypothetical protein
MKRSILVAACLLALCSCAGGGGAAVQPAPAPGQPAPSPGGAAKPQLGLLRSASGVPLGVEVSWPRVDVAGVQGYYIYRGTASFPDGPPTGFEGKRVNGGNLVNSGNPGSGTSTQTFDDLFSAAVGTEYYYRVTVVNATGDESDFSAELNITIAQQSIDTVSQTGGDIGDQVTIDGSWFGSSRNGDQVFFSDSTGSIDVPVAAGDYVSWSQTEIVVKVPYGAADGSLQVNILDLPAGADQDSAQSDPIKILLPPPPGWGGIGQL